MWPTVYTTSYQKVRVGAISRVVAYGAYGHDAGEVQTGAVLQDVSTQALNISTTHSRLI